MRNLTERKRLTGLLIVFALVLTGAFAAGMVGAQEGGEDLMEFDPSAFDPATSTIIDNEWLPMTPGMQLSFEGTAFTAEGEEIERAVMFTVTDLTKVINGVNAVVVWEQDFNDGERIETELIFFAQDMDGNVWHLGQYSESYDGDDLIGGQAWLVGHLEGAHAGIFMWADPPIGGGDYSQGFAPEPYNWTDRARVTEIQNELCVPADCFDEALVTEEFDASEPGAIQVKVYARGVGNVLVDFAGEDQEQERMELVEFEMLDEDGLAEVREEALALETRANVYGSTQPAVPRM